MKWIKYKILQCIVDELPIFIEKKVGHSEENLTIAQSEAYNKEYTIEEDSEETFEAPFFKTGLGKLLCDSGDPKVSVFTDGSVEIPDINDYSIFAVYINFASTSSSSQQCIVLCTKGKNIQGVDCINGHNIFVTNGGNLFFRFSASIQGTNLTDVKAQWTDQLYKLHYDENGKIDCIIDNKWVSTNTYVYRIVGIA